MTSLQAVSVAPRAGQVPAKPSVRIPEEVCNPEDRVNLSSAPAPASPPQRGPERPAAGPARQGFIGAVWAALAGAVGFSGRFDLFADAGCLCKQCERNAALPLWDANGVPPLDFEWGKLSDEQFAQKMTQYESLLTDSKAEVVSQHRLGGGINQTYVVTLSNGATAVWKPASGQKMGKLRDRVDPGLEPQREAAAYLVDRAMGHYSRVPVSVLRPLQGELGSLTMYIPGSLTAADERALRRLSGAEDHPAYKRIALLDHVIGNLDRHKGNWLAQTGADGNADLLNAVPIDHGLAFPRDNGPQGDHNFAFREDVVLDDRQRASLEELKSGRSALEAQLKPLISTESIEAMFGRVETILNAERTSQEWRGVPTFGQRLKTALFDPRPFGGMLPR